MICCDTCPFSPTCEEEDDFRRQIFGLDDEGQDHGDYPEDDYE